MDLAPRSTKPEPTPSGELISQCPSGYIPAPIESAPNGSVGIEEHLQIRIDRILLEPPSPGPPRLTPVIEAIPNNTSPTPQDLFARLADLDNELLAAVTGDECRTVERMALRHELVARLTGTVPPAELLRELQERTTRLEEKFLHWRRTAIMDLSGIDRHLLFLRQLQTAGDSPRGPRVSLTG